MSVGKWLRVVENREFNGISSLVDDLPGSGTRVTKHSHGWRDQHVATNEGIEGDETDYVNRPICYSEYNNLAEKIVTERYDGDTVGITTDANSDGVPNPPSWSLLRAKTAVDIDDQGRVYRTLVYSIASDGTVGSSLNSQSWYDHRGNVMKMVTPGVIAMKYVYDGAGRTTITYTSGDIGCDENLLDTSARHGANGLRTSSHSSQDWVLGTWTRLTRSGSLSRSHLAMNGM